MNLRFGSVCSGIEAASVAWHPMGWAAAWFAEIEKFPSTVLAHHYPGVPNLGDMTAIARMVLLGDVEAPDALVGGTPCQAFSVAGMRKGLSDSRGQLTISYVELANAIDTARSLLGKQPAIDIWENVPGVLSSKDNAFGCFLGALAGEDGPIEPPGGRWKNAGCVFGPQRAIAWRILDAQYFGVAQRRRRVFLVASARENFDPAAILFEFEGLRRDTAPRRKKGEDAPAGTLRSSDGGSDVTHAVAGHIQPVAGTLDASFGRLQGCSGQDANHGHSHLVPIAFDTTQVTSRMNFSNPQPGDACHPLAAGAHPPAIAFDCKSSGQNGFGIGDIAGTMRSMSSTTGHANGGGHLAVCVTGEITHTLKAEGFDASEDGTGRGQPIVTYGIRMANTSSNGWGIQEEVTHTLDTTNGVAIGSSMAVRRLTPRECERLQGFPDNYTQVPVRGKPAADGPRYKSLGNSMAVPCMRWIGKRIATYLDNTELLVEAS
ncbi:DNA cytosine methyltransferase [Herbaspirillum chlorophenolicum]|uniref:DNA (cytosine-5-)-methyltransferase n=1 Tax=Herbaspirillum chlorophenolicum TaxID=211589 RepID=A0ABW8F132_9BURK